MIRTAPSLTVPVLLVVILLPATALAHGAKEPPTVWLEGELIDLACYVAHGARGSDNALCASQRSSLDQPIALLTEEGEIVLLWADHHSTHPYELCRQLLGNRVRVWGTKHVHRTTVAMEVRKVKRLEKDRPTDYLSPR